MNAVDSVAFDLHSIKAATKRVTIDKFTVVKQTFKRKHEDGCESPLMLTYKRIKNVQNFWYLSPNLTNVPSH